MDFDRRKSNCMKIEPHLVGSNSISLSGCILRYFLLLCSHFLLSTTSEYKDMRRMYFFSLSLRLALGSKMMISTSTTLISRSGPSQLLSRTIVGQNQSLLTTGLTAASYKSGRLKQLTSPSLLSTLLLLEL